MTQSTSTTSITIKRWLSLALCAVTASILLFFFSESMWFQTAFSTYSRIITANTWVYHASAFIAGIAIKVSLDRLRVTHPKRMTSLNLRYPPITISIWLTILIISGFSILSRDNSTETIGLMVNNKVLSQLCLITSGICIAHLVTSNNFRDPSIILTLIAISLIYLNTYNHLVSEIIILYNTILLIFILLEYSLVVDNDKSTNTVNAPDETNKKETEELASFKDFQNWFKDDTPIKTIDQLEPDYQVYANRIYERLIHGETKTELESAQQIALCGPFGCGKSSIITAIVNQLKQSTSENTPENTKKNNWLHCDISTWGIQADHVAQVLLTHVIDTIAEKLDMCAFRSLPKHYVEAMKGGGSHWQIMAALLNKATDVETSLAELNSVLSTTNINLLITVQDIDRGTADDIARRLNELAALLDRLKNLDLKNINFIIALGAESHDQAEIVSKITSRTEHILKKDTNTVILNYIEIALKDAVNNNKIIILSDHTSGLNPNELHTVTIETEEDINRIFVKKPDDGTINSPQHKVISRHKNNIFRQEVHALSNIIDSHRLLKKILRRVDEAWKPNKLMGEINIISLIMLSTFREVKPNYFSKFQQEYDYLYKTARLKIPIENIQEIVTDKNGNVDEIYVEFIIIMLGLVDINIFKENASATSKSIDKNNENFLMLDPRISPCQTLGSTDDPHTNYLKRFQLEAIPKTEEDTGNKDQKLITEPLIFSEKVRTSTYF